MLKTRILRRLTFTLAVAGALALTACGNDNGDSGDDDNTNDCTVMATWSSIHGDLLSTPTCATSSCHAPPTSSGGLDFSQDAATVHGSLVGAPSEYIQATRATRIVAGTSTASWFYVKISEPLPPGGRMPSGGALSQCDIDMIRTWIQAGAAQ